MIDLLLWVWINGVALGIGILLVRLILQESQELNVIYSMGLGLGLLSMVMFCLGVMQLYDERLIWTILLAGSLLLLYRFLRVIRKFISWFNILSLHRTLSRFEKLCGVVILLICLRSLLGTLTPELRHDVMDYHLNFPNLYVLHQGIYETPWHVFSYNPFQVEMLYTLGLILGSDDLAKLVHWGFGLLCTLAVIGIGKRYFGFPVAVFAALLWITQSIVTYLSTTCYIDLGVAFWEFLGFGCLLRYFEVKGLIRSIDPGVSSFEEKRGYRWLLLTGLFSGLAIGSKYTAIILYLIPLILMVLILGVWKGRFLNADFSLKQALGAAFLLSTIALMVSAPWWIRNFVWTGNPFYPLFNQFMGFESSVAINAEEFFRNHAPRFTSVADLFLHLKKKIVILSMHGTTLINQAAVVMVLLLIKGWISTRENQETPHRQDKQGQFLFNSLIIFTLLVYFIWVFGTVNLDGRFMLGGLLPLCLLLSKGYLYFFQWFTESSVSKACPALVACRCAVSTDMAMSPNISLSSDMGNASTSVG